MMSAGLIFLLEIALKNLLRIETASLSSIGNVLACEISTLMGLISNPIACRYNRCASTKVAPEPQYGSRTVSPGSLNRLIKTEGSCDIKRPGWKCREENAERLRA